MAINLMPHARKKWRAAGYYFEGTETISQIPGGLVRRNDLFGFTDALLIPEEPGVPWIYLQVTGWTNVSTRYRKIQNEQTGRGQWAVQMRWIAEQILTRGDRIIVEGWRKNKKTGRYESREKEITLENLSQA